MSWPLPGRGRSPGYPPLLLGGRGGTLFFANVYSDSQHTAILWLYDHAVDLPQLHCMCRDFNGHRSWDPDGPVTSVHASQLLTVAEGCGLALGRPEEAGPTHFPVQGNFNPTVINLMFVPMALSLTMEYEIHVEGAVIMCSYRSCFLAQTLWSRLRGGLSAKTRMRRWPIKPPSLLD
jgi:hypothetical protein